MINTRQIKKVIDGVPFTFVCERTKHEGFDDKVTYFHNWIWSADCFGSVTKKYGKRKSVRAQIPYQIKAAKLAA